MEILAAHTCEMNDVDHREMMELGHVTIPGCLDPAWNAALLKSCLLEFEAASHLPWGGGGKWFGHVNYFSGPNEPFVLGLVSNVAVRSISAPLWITIR